METKTLQDYENIYVDSSKTLSSINRQIVFAGIALIWIFTKDKNKVPSDLILPAIFFVASLLFDIIQYAYTTCTYKQKFKICETQIKNDKLPLDTKFEHSNWLVIPQSVCFWTKVGLTVIAYILIFVFLWTTLVEK